MRSKLLTIVLLFSVGTSVRASTEHECMRYMLWKESRGEGILTARAVYDVAINRSKKLHKNLCETLRQPGAYPYMKFGVKRVDLRQQIRYDVVRNMQRVVPESVLYFNDSPPSYGKPYKRIGKLWFNKEK